ncbi:MAG: type VI secretion system baseplate subunit TssE [Edaphobacter sp.]
MFDRLVDSAPEVQKELTPLRVHGRDALFASIARDLQRLLNTRRASDAPLDSANATVLDYGIPDFSQFSASSVTDRRHLTETLRLSISVFEPRLQEISIHLESSDSSPHQILGNISCKARLGNLLEPMTFPILLHSSEHTIEVIALVDQSASELLSKPSASEPSHG